MFLMLLFSDDAEKFGDRFVFMRLFDRGWSMKRRVREEGRRRKV